MARRLDCMIGDVRRIISPRPIHVGEDGVEITWFLRMPWDVGVGFMDNDVRKDRFHADWVPGYPGGWRHPMPLYGHEMDDSISPKEEGTGEYL